MSDPRYLWVLARNSEHTYTPLPPDSKQTHYRINQWGFRGDNLDPLIPAHRIMVYGDSNVEARFSDDEQTFPVQLHRQLAANFGLDYQVINAGVAGYGPDQVALRIEDEIDVWRPDLVIVVIFADNDYGDLLRNGLYQIGADGALSRYDRGWVGRWLGDHLKSLMIGRAILKIDQILQPLPLQYPDAAAWQALPLDQKFKTYLTICDLEYHNYEKGTPISWGRDHYDFDVALFPDADSSKLKRALIAEVLVEIGRTGGKAW